jgi:hypothetical protein
MVRVKTSVGRGSLEQVGSLASLVPGSKCTCWTRAVLHKCFYFSCVR